MHLTDRDRRPVVIVGAGITGCVAAHSIAKQGKEVVVVERERQVGGLARTFRYGKFSFDIGPHRFFSEKKEVLSYIYKILDGKYSSVLRKSGICFLGKYYSWPLRPMCLFKLPLFLRLNSLFDLFKIASFGRSDQEDTFERYILSNYGPTLYSLFFEGYTTKFLKMSPGKIHPDWARNSIQKAVIDGRISHGTIVRLLSSILRSPYVKTNIIYPEAGVDVFCQNLVHEIMDRHNGAVMTGATISSVTHAGGSVCEVVVDGKKIKPSHLVWTGKIADLCSLLKIPDPGLEYLSLVIYNIEINKPVQLEYQWCYYGNDEIFSRISVPSHFSENMSPEGKHGLCVEVTCREQDSLWNHPETQMQRVIQDLQKVGVIKDGSEIQGIHIEKISNAYPVYDLRYRERRQMLFDALKIFKNITLAGRSGLFWYNNMDDSIENGLSVAQHIVQGEG